MSIKRERVRDRQKKNRQEVSLYIQGENGYLERQGHLSKKDKVYMQRKTIQREIKATSSKTKLFMERDRKRKRLVRKTTQKERETFQRERKNYLERERDYLERE